MIELFRRVLVPHDFSVRANGALEVAVALAEEHRGRVRVLHALSPSAVAHEVVWASRAKIRAGLREGLEREVAELLGKRAARVECEVVIAEPIRAIVAAARKADSIVMATLGETGLAHFLLGSTTEKVVRLSPVPVLTVHVKPKRRRPRTRARSR